MDLHTHETRFKQWLTEHRGILVKVTRSFAAVREDFDDLFQEILLQLWKSIPAFRADSSVSTWVYRVALNRALEWKRKESRRPTAAPILESDPDTPATDCNQIRERAEALYVAIRRLPKADRALILLVLDGLSYREIAAIVDITENNVGVRLHRIKQQLSQILERN